MTNAIGPIMGLILMFAYIFMRLLAQHMSGLPFQVDPAPVVVSIILLLIIGIPALSDYQRRRSLADIEDDIQRRRSLAVAQDEEALPTKKKQHLDLNKLPFNGGIVFMLPLLGISGYIFFCQLQHQPLSGWPMLVAMAAVVLILAVRRP